MAYNWEQFKFSSNSLLNCGIVIKKIRLYELKYNQHQDILINEKAR